jgi:hypothetical protein
MSKYAELHGRLSELTEQRQSAAKQGSKAVLYGGLGLGLSLLALILLLTGDFGSTYRGLALLSATATGTVLGIGLMLKIQGKSKVNELDTKIKVARASLAPLEDEREKLLARIKTGDLAALASFADYVLQELPIDLPPLEDNLRFRPQKGETCFAQVIDVPLGRFKSRTVTRKVGGGYRIGRVYVPVQKERVQTIEMNTLDVGTLAITDRRVLYLGAARKLTTRLDKILELEAYRDALSVTKEGRQSADFFLEVDGELLAAILDGIESSG